MSVRTTADEKLDSAREHLRQAYGDLMNFLNPDTHGSKEYLDSFIRNVEDITIELNRLRRKLK